MKIEDYEFEFPKTTVEARLRREELFMLLAKNTPDAPPLVAQLVILQTSVAAKYKGAPMDFVRVEDGKVIPTEAALGMSEEVLMRLVLAAEEANPVAFGGAPPFEHKPTS